jgi:hypothetical protein
MPHGNPGLFEAQLIGRAPNWVQARTYHVVRLRQAKHQMIRHVLSAAAHPEGGQNLKNEEPF